MLNQLNYFFEKSPTCNNVAPKLNAPEQNFRGGGGGEVALKSA